MHFKTYILGLTLTSAYLAQCYQPYPFNPNDPDYVGRLRLRLDSFHENLSRGNISENAMMVAPDSFWNYEGTLLINNTEWGKALRGVVEGSFKGVYIPDYYELVDGNLCATLWELQGKQTGPFLGQPVTPGARFQIWGSELWIFDEDLLVNELYTVSETGRLRDQLAGKEPVPSPTPNGTQPIPAGKSSKRYKEKTRAAMASLHRNANAGNIAANEPLATESVEVVANGVSRTGRKAFAEIAAAINQGQGAITGKQFHDNYILADGKQGMIDYFWHGYQTGSYNGVAADTKLIRIRAALYFEFNKRGLVRKVVSVYDELVIAGYVAGTTKYLYP